jgi:hypothetical protein
VAEGLAGVAGAIEARREALRAAAVSIGAEMGRALAWRALAAEPLAVAEALLGEILPSLAEVTEVTVEVPPPQCPALAARLAAIMRDAPHAPMIEVRAAPDLRPGEARLRWRDGWAERLLHRIEAEAMAALAAAVGAPAEAGLPAIDSLIIEETRG